jgi:sialate O-acetylesterase
VGHRLALAAERVAYGDKNVVAEGPLYQSLKPEGNQLAVNFTDVGGGLMAKGGGPLGGFTVAGADKKFYPATARIEGSKVVVSSPQVTAPVAVRYAWSDNPEDANLYNKEGLPASTFRTDDF